MVGIKRYRPYSTSEPFPRKLARYARYAGSGVSHVGDWMSANATAAGLAAAHLANVANVSAAITTGGAPSWAGRRGYSRPSGFKRRTYRASYRRSYRAYKPRRYSRYRRRY